MLPWTCRQCGEDQLSARRVPAARLCNTCQDAQRARTAYTEAGAGIPPSYRNLTRAGWENHFQHPWPSSLHRWTGNPRWVALWGPTGTGKTGIATVLLAEHLRTGQPGRWIAGTDLAWRIQQDFTHTEDVLVPLLVTPLLVLDEPLSASAADWYLERLLLLTRTRDERGLATIITNQLLPELIGTPNGPASILSRWLSGIRLPTADTADTRLEEIPE
jgi:hypothetical protein